MVTYLRALLGRVLRFAAGAGASRDDKQLLLKQVSKSPGRMLARTEHAIDIRKRLIDSLETGS